MHDLEARWTLDPAIDFLNHGSYGACPRPVQEAQSAWRARLERDPVRFFGRELEAELDAARAAVAEFCGSDARDLAFVTNATSGVNAVLASAGLRPGDEILITNHGYAACRNAAHFWAERAGARVAVAEVPFPIADPAQVLDAVLAAIGPRTRLALIDHVTSPTALIFPVRELVRELRARGVRTLIDGAHALGMLALDLRELDADYYVANLHKWCCAPKGAALLRARPELQAELRPLVVSHGYASARADRSRFLLEFDWPGTADPSAPLCAPVALRFLAELLPGGWPELQAANARLARAARRVLTERLGVPPPCPESMLGAMASIPLAATPARSDGVEALYTRLFEEHRFQVPVSPWPAPPGPLLRISAHAYNHLGQYERLAEVLAGVLGRP